MISMQNVMKLGKIQNLAIRATVAAGLFAVQAAMSPVAAAGGPFSSGRMVSHMTRNLNLSDTQAQQVQQVFDSRQAQMTAQFQALKSARQTLRQATLANPVDEGAIRGAAQALGQAEGDAALLRAQVHAQILPLLNADQRQKFATLAEGHRGHWSRGSHAPAVSQ
jgi:Spy/CpxP family protein refolding chaperone